MKVDVTQDGILRLKDVFTPILFETAEGEDLVVCMRDNGYEIGIKDLTASTPREVTYYKWYVIKDGQVKPAKSFPEGGPENLLSKLFIKVEDNESNSREMAIAIIAEARKIHERWAEYFENYPEKESEYKFVGNVAHHRKWIKNYDEVLAELERPEPEAKVEAEQPLSVDECILGGAKCAPEANCDRCIAAAKVIKDNEKKKAEQLSRLVDMLFERIWQAIKHWDIDNGKPIPGTEIGGYSGVTGDDVRTIIKAVLARDKVDETSKEAFEITKNVTTSNAQTLREVRSGMTEEAEQPPQPIEDRAKAVLDKLVHELGEYKALAEHRLGIIKKLEKDNDSR